jgi:hypothetical protein
MKPIPAITLGKDHRGKDISIDIETLLKTRLLIQANSGGGKSFLIRRMCEQLFGHVPVIIIDPEGEFATLREKFGYVLVGKGGETPADPRSAKLVAHKLLELSASAVIDLYEMNPSQRHEYVKLFSEAMIDAPKNLWRPTIVIFDEAHTFAPEKGSGESVASDAVTAFSTRGRKRRFCSVFATQRLGKLRKDASAELLNRLVGPTFEDVDLKRAADLLSIPGDQRRAFDAEMRVLEPGNFYALGRAICKERTLFKVGGVQTSHEIEQAKFGSEPPPTPEKIKNLLPQLADLPKQAEEKIKTEKELKQQVVQLRRELDAALEMAKKNEIAALSEDDWKKINRAVELYESMTSEISRFQVDAKIIKEEIAGISSKVKMMVPALRNVSAPAHQRLPSRQVTTEVYQRSRPLRPAAIQESNGTLPIGEEKILAACIQFPNGVTRQQLTVLTGFKRSTRDAYISRLREKQYVGVTADLVIAERAGYDALPNAQPLPTGSELQNYWLNKLPDGERKIFEILLDHYPDSVDKESITERTGFKRSTRDAYLSRMSSKMITTEPSRGMVMAASELFE